MTSKYKVICSDPPWSYRHKSLNRGGAERHYGTTSTADLAAIPVQQVCDDDCIMFMWATFPCLPDALVLMTSWGFTYKTIGFNWVKTNKNSGTPFWGMGSWTRSNSEVCLIGTRGKPERISASVHSVIHAPVTRHSEKPPEVLDKIVELCGDVPRLVMFSRQAVPGWDVFGNEAPDSIQLL